MNHAQSAKFETKVRCSTTRSFVKGNMTISIIKIGGTTSCKIVETLSVKNDFFMKNTSWLTKETVH